MKTKRIHSRVAVLALILAMQCSAASIIHDYQFNGNLTDSLGGPSLVGLGGTVGPSTYTFAAGQGLSLSNALPDTAGYSIALQFSLLTVSGFRRILEFKNLGSDNGLYTVGGDLRFYPVNNVAVGVLTANVPAELVFTRNSATNTASAYINGVQVLTFTDLSNYGIFSGPNGIIHFFQDDGTENSGGVVDRIRIYNGALTSQEVADINNVTNTGVPEPGTLVSVAAALGAIVAIRRRAARS